MAVAAQKSVASLMRKTLDRQEATARNKFRFKQRQVEKIILHYVKEKSSGPYADLVKVLQEYPLNDENYKFLIEDCLSCVMLLGREFKQFVGVLCKVDWTSRSDELVELYGRFTLSLVTAHTYHCHMVLTHLIQKFKADGENWDGNPPAETVQLWANIHSLIAQIVATMPMTSDLLMQIVIEQFPYYKAGAFPNRSYIHNLIWMTRYIPSLREHIMTAIIIRMVELDSNLVDGTKNKQQTELMFEMETDEADELAPTLDYCMLEMLRWMEDERDPVLFTMCSVFERVVLPTHDIMCNKVKVQDLDLQSQELIKGSNVPPCARFGDTGYTLPILFKQDADKFRNMAVRPGDVWVTTFPRSGTTFTRELVWLLMNDCNFSAALETKLCNRYFFFERRIIPPYVPNQQILDKIDATTCGEISNMDVTYDMIADAPSPRFIFSHLAFSLLPLNLLDTTKVVYVARDPRDVVVSWYHFYRLLRYYTGDFKSFWDLFINNLVLYSPYFPHVKEAWSLRHHPNMMFIFYENITKDLPSYIKKIADFLGKEVTSKQIVELCEHMNINNFKKNDSVNMSWAQYRNPDAESFVRKGGSGGWREYFDEEMAAQAQRWLRENLADTDLRFPQHDAS